METTPTPSTPPPVIVNSSEVRTWTVLCHASALAGIFFHFLGHLGGPLIVWLLKRHEAAEIDAHGKEAVNFQLTWLIYDAIALILCVIVIGIPMLVLLWILNIVFVIVASLKASEGKLYRYPFTIRFLN